MAKEYVIDGKKVIGWHTSASGKRVPHFEENNTPLSKYADKINNTSFKDLDKLDYEEMYNDYENWYKSLNKKEIEEVLDKYNEHRYEDKKESNPLGEYLNKKLGYDKLPQLIEEKDFFNTINFRGKDIIDYDTILLDENHWYRGIGEGENTQKYINEFKTGKFYAGEGYEGNGSFFTMSNAEAQAYAGNNDKNMIYAIPKNSAKTVDIEKIKYIKKEISSKMDWNKYMTEEGELYTSFTDAIFSDNGYTATLLGYDIINTADSRRIVLNRSSLKVVK